MKKIIMILMGVVSIESQAAHFSISKCENKNVMYVKYDNDNSNILIIQDDDYTSVKNKNLKDGYFFRNGKMNKILSYSLEMSSDKSEGLLTVVTTDKFNGKIVPINLFEVPIDNCPIYKNFNKVIK